MRGSSSAPRVREGKGFRLAVVILAAGASQRMGCPKLLLPWGKASIIEHLLRQWKKLKARQILVVTAPGDKALQALCAEQAELLVNPAPERGMLSTIQTAAAWDGWQPGLTHWGIVLGDQPQISMATLRTLLKFARSHATKICQPRYRGRGRHPVIMPRSEFDRLPGTDALHLKAFLERAGTKLAFCDMDEPSLEKDIDTPEDYARSGGGSEMPKPRRLKPRQKSGFRPGE